MVVQGLDAWPTHRLRLLNDETLPRTHLAIRRAAGSFPGKGARQGLQGLLEVRAGIEPASADLQSDASPLCHRTPGAGGGIWFGIPFGVKSEVEPVAVR